MNSNERRAKAQEIQALIAAQQRNLDRMDAKLDRLQREYDQLGRSIGLWTVQRNAGRENMHDLQAMLAENAAPHYAAMAAEAQAMARDKAQGFADDFADGAA